ncbi:IclR family transcriptional regulator [Kocuria sp.]|uniref:IclR family transcriptional regulator n=1 Tax=Kocuria sp. TaxID=1871328 RepID=UPI0026E0BBDA|nr:helix-turn-helix domain-containing protein [Kocuria sp.]MDO5617408.1 helix-turn-helix domain-containing protein [Kocuria sp.]
MANSRSGESVLERVDRILGVFSPQTPRLTVTQVARNADLPVSTVHRLCTELAQRGWLEAEGGAFVIGTRLWELATRAARESTLAAIALPFMQDAQTVLGQHVQLGRVEGREVLILQRLSAHGAREISSGVAGRLPLHVSAVGLVLLAGMPTGGRQEYLAALRAGDHVIPQGGVAQLEAVLASIRSVGHVIQTGNLEPDRTGIAVPVHSARAEVVAGLGAVLDRSAVVVDPEATVQVLRAAAHGIERIMRQHPHNVQLSR